MSRRRAASLARRASADIVTFLVAEAEFTVELSNLKFEGEHDGEVARVDQGIAGVLEDSKQIERVLRAVPDPFGRTVPSQSVIVRGAQVLDQECFEAQGASGRRDQQRTMRWWMTPMPLRMTVGAPSP